MSPYRARYSRKLTEDDLLRRGWGKPPEPEVPLPLDLPGPCPGCGVPFKGGQCFCPQALAMTRAAVIAEGHDGKGTLTETGFHLDGSPVSYDDEVDDLLRDPIVSEALRLFGGYPRRLFLW